MHFEVQKSGNGYSIRFAEGSHYGKQVATVERLRMVEVKINNGPVIRGRIEAAWGIEILPDFDLNATTLRSLGINKPFRPLTRPRDGAIVTSDKGFILGADGSTLTACAALELQEGGRVQYSLHKDKNK